MTVADLGTLLNGIVTSGTNTMKFAHHAWSTAPDGDYGIYAEDMAVGLSLDNIVGEQMLEGTIDYFTRDDSGTPMTQIQAALNAAGVHAHLNSIQYEQDTGYIHYEWVFDING